MQTFLLTFASYLLLKLASSNDKQTYSHFSTTVGLLRGDLSRKNIATPSFLFCTMWGCDHMLHCVGSINKRTGACRTTVLSAAPISWSKENLFNNDEED